jgi:hypothetical protein
MKKLSKNRALKTVLAVLILAMLIVFAAKFIRITPEKSGENNSVEFDEGKPKISITIECTSVYKEENYSKLDDGLKADGVLPSDGYFAENVSVNFSDGDTVFDALTDYCNANNIAIDSETAAENAYGTAYVKGIGGLYEGDCTKNSGWVYSVNGEMPDCGMSDFTLSDGDEISVSFVVF